MTRFELWTMDDKKLLLSYRNAVRGQMGDNPNATRAMEIFGGEILRRLQILRDMDEED